MLTKVDEIRNYGFCMDATSKSSDVKTLNCHLMGGNQKWEYDEQVSCQLPDNSLHKFDIHFKYLFF